MRDEIFADVIKNQKKIIKKKGNKTKLFIEPKIKWCENYCKHENFL